MNIGYDKPLYMLPFDHRGSFQTKMFGWKGDADRRADGRDRRHQAGDLRRLQGRRRGRRGQGQGRHSRGRAVRRRHPARCRQERLLHRLPRREKRPGRIRFRIRRGLRQAHRGVQPHFLQGAGALQPRRRQGAQPAPGRPAETAVGLLPQQRPANSCSSCWCPRSRPSSTKVGGDKKTFDASCGPS